MSARAGVSPGPARRALDIAAAGLALVMLCPLLLVIALAVRVTSRGPALYRQVRVGQGGRPFTLFKFRTMKAAPSNGGDLTPGNDPRVTAVGKILRAASLDELPQFFNVLKGDMTLVGFRPETPGLAAKYAPELLRIFEYRPGITGPAQISERDTDVLPQGPPDAVEAYYLRELVPARVALSIDYLQHPTFGRTLSVLFRTAGHVLSGMLPTNAKGRERSSPSPGEPAEEAS
jgi:lipopolysaccharide/colanic/teichoic acid biosynthesis glycosyltransferase